MNPETPSSDPRVIGYDAEGHPIYDAPPREVSMPPAVIPDTTESSEDTEQRHQESVAAYPKLNLSDKEYVVLDVQRHSIGLAIPMIATALVVGVILSLLLNLPAIVSQAMPSVSSISYAPVWLGGLLLIALCLIGCGISVWVYRNNQLIVTSESVVQQVQRGLLMHDEQTASLGSIENVNYEQNGLMQMLFNYGTISMRTVGDETSYGLTYVSSPRQQTATINTTIEAFKNNRRSAE